MKGFDGSFGHVWSVCAGVLVPGVMIIGAWISDVGIAYAQQNEGHRLYLKNQCRYPIRIAVRYRDWPSGEWMTGGWWECRWKRRGHS